MNRKAKSAAELREMISAEFGKQCPDSIDRDALIIVPKASGWWATIRQEGARIDEVQLAAVAEISLSLSKTYDLDAVSRDDLH